MLFILQEIAPIFNALLTRRAAPARADGSAWGQCQTVKPRCGLLRLRSQQEKKAAGAAAPALEGHGGDPGNAQGAVTRPLEIAYSR